MANGEEFEFADCPGAYGYEMFELCSKDKKAPVFGYAPTYLSLCSCFASMFGSVLVVIPFLMWKDVRSCLRRIVTYLAVADFFTAFGYTMASFNYIRYKQHTSDNYPSACKTFSTVCQIQAYISSWASLSSFWWTAILAFYLYCTITKGNTNALNKWFPLFHILAWGSPILFMLPLLATDSLGYSLFSAGGWCFIGSDKSVHHMHFVGYKLSLVTIIKILAGGKAVEIATYIWVFALYGIIFIKLRKKKRLAAAAIAESSNALQSAPGFINLLSQMEKKLYMIPIAFILVRMWGTLQFIFSIIVFNVKHNNQPIVDDRGCVPEPIYDAFYFFACIQAIGDGGQGWCNAILYILLSPKIRLRLLSLICSPICNCLYDTVGLFNSESILSKGRKGGSGREVGIQYRSTINTTTVVSRNNTNNNNDDKKSTEII